MANPGGTRAPQRLAQQRYLNKASGRMETADQMHHYSAPAHHAVPSGHQVASTKHTVVQHPTPKRQPPDWLHMNTGQLLQFAKKLVGEEVSANRIPFQQAERRLEGQEGATRQNAERLATQGNQAGAQLVASQKAEGEAGEQRAREAQTQAVMPTDVQRAAQEHGLAPTEQGSRQEALLKALGQGGVNQAAGQRAAGEKWAQSQAAAFQQEGTAGIQAVGTRFANTRGKNREEEAAQAAKATGQTTKIYTDLLSEKQKFSEAAKANRMRALELGLKDKQAGERVAATIRGQNVTAASQAAARRQAAQEGAAGRAIDWAHLTETGRHNLAMEEAAAAKARLDAENKKHGKHSAASEKLTGEASQAFWAMSTHIRKAVGEGKAGKHVKPDVNKRTNKEIEAMVRAGLPQGKAGEPQAKDPAAIQAGIELWRYHTIGKATRAALARKGYKIGPTENVYHLVSGE